MGMVVGDYTRLLACMLDNLYHDGNSKENSFQFIVVNCLENMKRWTEFFKSGTESSQVHNL